MSVAGGGQVGWRGVGVQYQQLDPLGGGVEGGGGGVPGE